MTEKSSKLASLFYTIAAIYVIGFLMFVLMPTFYLRDLLINFIPYILLLHAPFLLGVIFLFSGHTNTKLHRYFCFVIVFSMTLQAYAFIRPYLHSSRSFAAEEEGIASLKVISANVLYSNTNYQKTIDLITTENPDIFGLVELTPELSHTLEVLEMNYPYYEVLPASGGFGLGLYSKYELKNLKIEYYPNKIPFITASIEKNQKPIHIILTHVMTPITSSTYEERNASLEMLAKKIKNHESALVMGDFNLTPWSHFYQKFIHDSNLVNVRNWSKGLQMSWLGFGLYLPIDHVFVSRNVTPVSFEIGPDIGSDHYPLISEFSY